MKAEILTIGDELLIGQIVNTNAAWLGEQLNLMGVEVTRMVTVGDDAGAIVAALDEAFRSAELVITTGGLGPTHDDVTKVAVARYFGVEMQFDEDTFERIRQRFARRGLRMAESNRSQAMVPEGFDMLPNPVGTAPGLWYAGEQGGRKRLLAVLQGVPHEMKTLMQDEVLPRLYAHKDLQVIGHRTLLTAGIGESSLQEQIGDLSAYLGPRLRLAFLPGTGGVRLRLSAYGDDAAEVEARLDRLEAHLRARAEKYIYGMNGDTLEAVVGRLLRERGYTVAVAESCTGGHVTHQLTNVSGSSSYVVGSIIAYSNAVKVGLLDVDPDVLDADGAVSEAVARQMARGVRARLGADVGVSTTGVAGPTGGTPDKPVGTVWIGYADAERDFAVLLRLVQDRILNKELTTTAVLNLLRRQLLHREAVPES